MGARRRGRADRPRRHVEDQGARRALLPRALRPARLAQDAGRGDRQPYLLSMIGAAGPSRGPFIAKPASRAHQARMMRHRSPRLRGLTALALSACAPPTPPGWGTRFPTTEAGVVGQKG